MLFYFSFVIPMKFQATLMLKTGRDFEIPSEICTFSTGIFIYIDYKINGWELVSFTKVEKGFIDSP